MDIKGKKIGIALTGSFCTFEKMFTELQKLKDAGADIYPILSDASQTIESRFGTPDAYVTKVKEITGKDPIVSIPGAEPIGPKAYLDALAILPCTGNTAAKLANGITDTRCSWRQGAYAQQQTSRHLHLDQRRTWHEPEKHRLTVQQQKHLFRPVWSGQLQDKAKLLSRARRTPDTNLGNGTRAQAVPANPQGLFLNKESIWKGLS